MREYISKSSVLNLGLKQEKHGILLQQKYNARIKRYFNILICGLQLLGEPYRSTRLLQLTGSTMG